MISSLDAETVEAALERLDLPPDVRRVLELRQLTGSASVKKLYSMDNMASRDNRLRDLIVHHGTHPGRPTGSGPQPLNLPKAGPKLVWCEKCTRPHKLAPLCPWCGNLGAADRRREWTVEMVPFVLEIMALRDLGMVERFFGDALLAISGCIRSLFVAADGYDFIATDYSSLQAVVLACLAGEQWRIDAFRAGEPMYLISASKITGTPVQWYLDYAEQHKAHHLDRQKGKTTELMAGFGGWLGAWRNMEIQQGIKDPMPDEDAKDAIKAWRAANPAIVEFWGGQWRGPPWRRERAEFYGLEGHFIMALQSPGTPYVFRGMPLRYDPDADKLTIGLLSGLRSLTYHQPRLAQSDRNADELSISYSGWNSNPNRGAPGWQRMSTYGGSLTENVVMAHEVEIQRHGIKALIAAGYPVPVLEVYDEVVLEVPHGFGTVEHVEGILSAPPPFARDWPIKAEGGWRGRLYRKV